MRAPAAISSSSILRAIGHLVLILEILEQIQRAKDAYLAALYTRQIRLRGEQFLRGEVARPLPAAPMERVN